MSNSRINFGVAVRILGKAGLRSHDTRRAINQPQLSVSLLYLRDILHYLAQQDIHFYRLADELLPYHDLLDQELIDKQLDECAEQLHELQQFAQQHHIRLSMHLGLHHSLAHTDATQIARSQAAICHRAQLLQLLGDNNSVIICHVGGRFGDSQASLYRFAKHYQALPIHAQAYLAVEADQNSFGISELLRLHQQLGVPIVFDSLHHQLHNPQRMPLDEALAAALSTWPSSKKPKIHYSSQRTEAHILEARGGQARQVFAPKHGQHADFLNPFECIQLLSLAQHLPPFDLMIEAKAADLALLRLRQDLKQFAPELLTLVR
jgi:UV DNA damage endonuclease